jgi:hypothetical protein
MLKGELMRRLRILAVAFAAVLFPAFAAIVDTPECRRDLATANQLIAAVQQRQSALDSSVRNGDTAKACGYLRSNQRDMSTAREQMNRCMTGFEKRENLGQMDASLGDIRDVLAARCRQ